jgi:hypothetical protein
MNTSGATDEQLIASRLNVQTVRIANKNFVTGLLWENLASVRSYMNEARALGKRFGMDIVAIREGERVQAGFAPQNNGAYKGMYSLASALAELLGDNFIGAFRLPGGQYAFVAISQGAVVAGADMLGDEDEIHTELKTVYSLLASASDTEIKVYAPVEFGFGGEEIDLSALLAGKKIQRKHQLKPLTLGLTKKEWIRLGVIGTVLLTSAYFGNEYYQKLEAKTHAEAVARAATEAERAAAALAAGVVIPKAPHPWASVAPFEAMLAKCEIGLSAVPLLLGGWVLDNARCSADGSLIATFAQQPGSTVNDFIGAVESRYKQTPSIYENGARGSFSATSVAAPGVDDALVPQAEALRAFVSHFQAIQAVVPLTLEPPPPVDPAATTPQPLVDWHTYKFQFDSPQGPASLLGGLTITGMRLNEIAVRLDPKAPLLTWTYTGALYAR